MMGKKTKQSSLFYYMNIGDMIPENHILRLINKYIDFSFIRKKTKHLYSNTGRPSIDPEVLLSPSSSKRLLICLFEDFWDDNLLIYKDI